MACRGLSLFVGAAMCIFDGGATGSADWPTSPLSPAPPCHVVQCSPSCHPGDTQITVHSETANCSLACGCRPDCADDEAAAAVLLLAAGHTPLHIDVATACAQLSAFCNPDTWNIKGPPPPPPPIHHCHPRLGYRLSARLPSAAFRAQSGPQDVAIR